MRKTIIAALLALAFGCVEQQARQPKSGVSNDAYDQAQQEHQEQCGIDHDNCIEWCDGKPEPEQYHCVFKICADALEECRGDG